MEPVVRYLSEVKSELSKVVWPKRQEVIKLTLMVITISAIVGIYVGGLDLIFTRLLSALLGQ